MWEDSRNGNYDIYGYDLETEKEVQVNTNTYDQWNPAVYEDCVIWVDSRYENKDIFGHYRSAAHGVRITTNGGNQANPAIYTDMVWQDSRNDNYHIYMYDLSLILEDCSPDGVKIIYAAESLHEFLFHNSQ